MRLSVLLPASFVLALASGTAFADRMGADMHSGSRSGHNRVLRERYAHRDHVAGRAGRSEHVRPHERHRVPGTRTDARANCADEGCGHAPHASVGAKIHTRENRTRQPSAIAARRAESRVHCAPDDATCGSRSSSVRARESSPAAKGESKGRHLTHGQMSQLRAAFMRLVAKACERRAHDGCGIGGHGGGGGQ